MRKLFLASLCVMRFTLMQADGKLTGSPVGTVYSVDYSNGQRSTTVNNYAMAFDGNLDTYFASYDRSYTWAGLDLGEAYVITRVGWSPRDDVHGEGRVVLGVFEGANRADFMDALPIYIISERGTIGVISYADVTCSRGFRYVRYVGPSDARCNIAEVEFYGHKGVGDDSHLYQLTNLPTVSIHTLNDEIPYDKEHQIVSQLTIISDDGTKLLSEPGTTRERGNASRSYPKKPYRIKFDKKQRLLDAPAKAKKWTLINNYGDKSLMRNLLAFELSKRLGMSYTPFGTAVDVLLNGEYKGCYQLCDQIEIDKNRVNITEMTPQDNSRMAQTGGYLVEIDAYAGDEDSWFYSTYGLPVSIKSPDSDGITTEQEDYIEGRFNLMESNTARYLDKDSFLRHFLVGELSGNTDTYWSVYMYKNRNESLFYTGPVWDFDLAFDNDNRTYPINSLSDYIYRTKGSCAGNMRSFVDKIVINDAPSIRKMVEIWDDARQKGLNEDHLVAFVDSMEEVLQASQRLNFLRWPILNEYVHQNPMAWGSYRLEVDVVRQYLMKRIGWMDNRLNYVFVPKPNGIEEIDAIDSQSCRIYNLLGTYCGRDLDGLPSGIYVVRQGKTVKKVRKNYAVSN